MCEKVTAETQQRFNTASGMRSHVTTVDSETTTVRHMFQYRKRYEVTCDVEQAVIPGDVPTGFNTASGMRSHVTFWRTANIGSFMGFQYRKRYEVTCDRLLVLSLLRLLRSFNTASGMRSHVTPDYHACCNRCSFVSIPQAV